MALEQYAVEGLCQGTSSSRICMIVPPCRDVAASSSAPFVGAVGTDAG